MSTLRAIPSRKPSRVRAAGAAADDGVARPHGRHLDLLGQQHRVGAVEDGGGDGERRALGVEVGDDLLELGADGLAGR